MCPRSTSLNPNGYSVCKALSFDACRSNCPAHLPACFSACFSTCSKTFGARRELRFHTLLLKDPSAGGKTMILIDDGQTVKKLLNHEDIAGLALSYSESSVWLISGEAACYPA
jgi:hypothetical protein